MNLYKWFNANKLALNFEKSCFTVVGRVDADSLYNISLGCHNLESVRCTKYRGVMSQRKHVY